MISAELSVSFGGPALGMAHAGFKHAYMAEFDHDGVETVLHNKRKGTEHVRDWPVGLKDVREIDWKKIATLDLVAGGPSCQPFGIAGKKLGQDDHRDIWPEAIRAIGEAKLCMLVFESARSSWVPRFQSYLNGITAGLERLSGLRRPNETHAAHLAGLNASRSKRDYQVVWQLVNVAYYGAAQIRPWVLIFRVHADVNVTPIAMDQTHSRDRLFRDQFATGEYWAGHRLKPRKEVLLARCSTPRYRVEEA